MNDFLPVWLASSVKWTVYVLWVHQQGEQAGVCLQRDGVQPASSHGVISFPRPVPRPSTKGSPAAGTGPVPRWAARKGFRLLFRSPRTFKEMCLLISHNPAIQREI